MENLSKFLEKIYKSLNKNTLIKESIIEIVEKHTRVNLKEENFSFNDGALIVSSSAAANNEIRLKEDQIKKELAEIHKVFVSKVFYK